MEVSIFGPGFGECVVLHLGNGDWAVVDSCLERGSKRPVALQYLERLGVDAARIGLVVATHWHDDHMQGISGVFRAAGSARFACTAAVQQPEFKEILLAWTGTRFLAGGSGVDELHRVMQELSKRCGDLTSHPAPRLASVNKLLWERSTPPRTSVKALSPSDAAVIATMARLRVVLPCVSKVRRRIPSLEANDASVVLSVEVGPQQVLLGADLEASQDRALGWAAIVAEFGSADGRHEVFKIPHHGSPSGHHDEVWTHLLGPEPWTATTPFVRGQLRLPSADDCRRILRYSRRSYLTAPPRVAKYRDPDRAVQKMVAEATRSAYFLPATFGHVRLRKVIDDGSTDWRVEVYGDAMSMADYVAHAAV